MQNDWRTETFHLSYLGAGDGVQNEIEWGQLFKKLTVAIRKTKCHKPKPVPTSIRKATKQFVQRPKSLENVDSRKPYEDRKLAGHAILNRAALTPKQHIRYLAVPKKLIYDPHTFKPVKLHSKPCSARITHLATPKPVRVHENWDLFAKILKPARRDKLLQLISGAPNMNMIDAEQCFEDLRKQSKLTNKSKKRKNKIPTLKQICLLIEQIYMEELVLRFAIIFTKFLVGKRYRHINDREKGYANSIRTLLCKYGYLDEIPNRKSRNILDREILTASDNCASCFAEILCMVEMNVQFRESANALADKVLEDSSSDESSYTDEFGERVKRKKKKPGEESTTSSEERRKRKETDLTSSEEEAEEEEVSITSSQTKRKRRKGEKTSSEEEWKIDEETEERMTVKTISTTRRGEKGKIGEIFDDAEGFLFDGGEDSLALLAKGKGDKEAVLRLLGLLKILKKYYKIKGRDATLRVFSTEKLPDLTLSHMIYEIENILKRQPEDTLFSVLQRALYDKLISYVLDTEPKLLDEKMRGLICFVSNQLAGQLVGGQTGVEQIIRIMEGAEGSLGFEGGEGGTEIETSQRKRDKTKRRSGLGEIEEELEGEESEIWANLTEEEREKRRAAKIRKERESEMDEGGTTAEDEQLGEKTSSELGEKTSAKFGETGAAVGEAGTVFDQFGEAGELPEGAISLRPSQELELEESIAGATEVIVEVSRTTMESVRQMGEEYEAFDEAELEELERRRMREMDKRHLLEIHPHTDDMVCCASIHAWATFVGEVAENARHWCTWIYRIIKRLRCFVAILNGQVFDANCKRVPFSQYQWYTFLRQLDEDIIRWRSYNLHIQELTNDIVEAFHGKRVECCALCLEDSIDYSSLGIEHICDALIEALKTTQLWRKWLSSMVDEAEMISSLTNDDINSIIEVDDNMDINYNNQPTTSRLQNRQFPAIGFNSYFSLDLLTTPPPASETDIDFQD